MKKVKKLFCILIAVLCVSSLAAENIVLESDVLKLVLHEQTGSYTLFRKTGKKGKLLALNDVSDNASSTFFAVKMDNSIRSLSRSGDILATGKLNDDGSASIIWEVGDALSVEARFSLISAVSGNSADTVRVDLFAQNLLEREITCSVKAIVDTVLGETSRIHFSTEKGLALRSEKEYEAPVQEKWLSTSNGKEAAALVFAGNTATVPDYVLIANRDRFLTDEWKPLAYEGRSFDTFGSPNNSAIGMWYEGERLRMFQVMKRTFFITTAGDGNVPHVTELVGAVLETETSAIEEKTYEETVQKVQAAVEAAANDTLSEDINTELLDYSYIQSLIDRIRLVEESENPDPEEVAQLSAEIDALILKLTR